MVTEKFYLLVVVTGKPMFIGLKEFTDNVPERSKGEDLRSSGTMYLAGSNPVVVIACMPEWSKGPDSSSGVVIRAGSNPAACIGVVVTIYFYLLVV